MMRQHLHGMYDLLLDLIMFVRRFNVFHQALVNIINTITTNSCQSLLTLVVLPNTSLFQHSELLVL